MTSARYRKTYPISWDQLHRDAKALAWRLLDHDFYKGIVAITRGGMAPAMIVARELDIRTVDTISVKSYDHQEQTEPKVIKAPNAEMMGADGAGVLIVDDLVDTGKTLELVRRLYPAAHYATVYAKPMGRPQVETFITEVMSEATQRLDASHGEGYWVDHWFYNLDLIDTYLAMILALVAINQPFTIWLMRSFFVDVPIELDEAACIDGCNLWQIFTKVALPVVRPGLWVTSLFSLLLAYNEFLFALVLTGPDTKTLPVAIAEYGAEDINYWSLSAAAAIGIMLPIVVFMSFMQRHLARGLAMGAIKG